MQQQNQGGESHYGVPPPDMVPFSPPAASDAMQLSSSKPPSVQPQQKLGTSYVGSAAVSGVVAGGGFPEHEMPGDAGAGSGSGSRSGASVGNRWPREETLALIRIRSEMDSNFRGATRKGFLWEDVSRKLADLGYKRSAKKCKEKFENVDKYYKRTKERRAGNNYHFFSELEALHAASGSAAPQPKPQNMPLDSSGPLLHAYTAPVSAPPPMSTLPPPTEPMQPAPISSAVPAPAPVEPPPTGPMQAAPAPVEPPSTGPIQPAPISSAAPAPAPVEPPPTQPLDVSTDFSSMSTDSKSDDEMTAETSGGQDRLGKRKRGSGGTKKMMSLCEGLMQQVVAKQEEMQRRFLETMEKREAKRTAREEAWLRQEAARLNLEQELLSQERAASASRDAAMIAFLQRIGGQPIQPPTTVVVPMPTQIHFQTVPPPRQHPRQPQPPPPLQLMPVSVAPPPRQLPRHQQPRPPLQLMPVSATPPQQLPRRQQPPPPLQLMPVSAAPPGQRLPQQQHKETSHHDAGTLRSAPPTSGASLELVPAPEQRIGSGLLGGGEIGAAPSPSRWPNAEVHALIQLRMELYMRSQEYTGPRVPLWEEISAGMLRLGYNRSSKRCKEKWDNINKYYKKVKESNKRRPQDSKTCPYFNQLEAIYRRKQVGSSTPTSAANVVAAAAPAFPEHLNPRQLEIEGKNINDEKLNNGGSSGGTQVPLVNRETPPPPTAAFDVVHSGTKKAEGIIRERNEQLPREMATDEMDSEDMGDEYTDDDGEEGDDDGETQYRIQFQGPKPGGANSGTAPATTSAGFGSGEHLGNHGSIGARAAGTP